MNSKASLLPLTPLALEKQTSQTWDDLIILRGVLHVRWISIFAIKRKASFRQLLIGIQASSDSSNENQACVINVHTSPNWKFSIWARARRQKEPRRADCRKEDTRLESDSAAVLLIDLYEDEK